MALRDVVVVGGGIVGLATARAVLLARPGTPVTVLEKEPLVGGHQTGHNSGVLHAGLYYAPGSRRAELTARGRPMMEGYAEAQGVPWARNGKLVVMVDEAERPRFEALWRRVQANGVPDARLLDARGARDVEPAVAALAAIHSPRTGVTDFAAIADRLAAEVAEHGGEVRTGVEVVSLAESAGEVVLATRAAPSRVGHRRAMPPAPGRRPRTRDPFAGARGRLGRLADDGPGHELAGARDGGARDGGARDGGARDGDARDGDARDGDARDTGARGGGRRPPGEAVEALDVVRTRLVVACAGLRSDRVAAAHATTSVPSSPDGYATTPPGRIVPFRGSWLELTGPSAALVRGNVYPVPDPALPFLGVHATRGVDGRVLAGPNAMLAGARERYDRRYAIDARDLRDALTHPGLWRLGRRHWRAGLDELRRDLSLAAAVADLRRYLPDVRDVDVTRGPFGVRAQLVTDAGDLFDDFAVDRTPRVLHVRNAPSPAATAALAIGDELAALVTPRLG